ncbi:MAG: entericidin A/B family lipoprotein [Alphaproteobacteria bacterium]|nr:entericidin A/B family lipoprotein [Alphaproteobacteria bacterium]
MQTFKSASIGAIMAMALFVSGCNTVEGIGQDVESAGSAIEDTARDVKN